MITPGSLVGSKLGTYQIEALLGRGGMSSVYRGFDQNLRRPVAIKVLSEMAAAQPGFPERFRQEARLIAALRHPHIVQVYDFGEQDGYSYMVQELLPGSTLEQHLGELAARGQHIARADILAIVAQIASALDAAHAAGIIHRDIKPANMLWNASGALVLTDFGIAKNLFDASSNTQTGLLIGTPHYLSPEQAQGLQITPASDIYSLGIVLYELISGQTPFAGATPLHVVMNHIQEPAPALLPQRPDLPPAVEAVVQRALAKDPATRFASAGELARALERAWPATPVAAALPDLHDQATRAWERPAAVPPTPVPARRAPIPQPAPIAPVPDTARGGIRLTLPVLFGLLLLLLIGGGAMVLRGGDRSGAAPGSTLAPIVQDTAAPPAPTEPPAPTAGPAVEPTIEPTIAPSVVPTVEPTAIPTPEPTAEPTATPIPEPTIAPPVGPPGIPLPVPPAPFAPLQALLEAGSTDGRAGRHGQELLNQLFAAQKAIADDNPKRATDRLRDLRDRLLDGARSGDIEEGFAREALAQIDVIARTYNLTLPPPKDDRHKDDKDKDNKDG